MNATVRLAWHNWPWVCCVGYVDLSMMLYIFPAFLLFCLILFRHPICPLVIHITYLFFCLQVAFAFLRSQRYLPHDFQQ